MDEQITNDEVVEEVTTEEDAPEENIDETTEGETDEESTEDDVDWKERAMKAERAIEKAKKKGKIEKHEEVSDPDRLNRLELKADGVTESEDQDYILRIAKADGVDVSDVLADKEKYDFVQDKLARNKRQRQSAQATPRGNNRTNTQVDEVQMWVNKYQKDGSLPDSMALTAKVLDALKNN